MRYSDDALAIHADQATSAGHSNRQTPTSPMDIVVQVPAILRSCCGGAAELTCTGPTARDLLRELEQTHPELHHSVCNETGAVRRHVNLFINESLVNRESQLDDVLRPGDVIAIFQAVSGG
ncbi:MoaD/ThiS family protein [Pirellulales bacterium]|nr:MoaD/ThiS family protein [Pirellulales bacterium]